jgi:hypothetical protein
MKSVNKYLKIINQIEKARTKNNVNWMDVLRVALKSNSEATLCLLRKINSEDKKISKLFEKFK